MGVKAGVVMEARVVDMAVITSMVGMAVIVDMVTDMAMGVKGMVMITTTMEEEAILKTATENTNVRDLEMKAGVMTTTMTHLIAATKTGQRDLPPQSQSQPLQHRTPPKTGLVRLVEVRRHN
jgi:hypothetical protein